MRFNDEDEIRRIAGLFAKHSVAPIYGSGEWFTIASRADLKRLRKKDIKGANLIGVLLLDVALFDPIATAFRLPLSQSVAQAEFAQRILRLTPSDYHWLQEGWDWRSCDTDDEFDYPPACPLHSQPAYRFGLSLTKYVIGCDREERRTYLARSIRG